MALPEYILHSTNNHEAIVCGSDLHQSHSNNFLYQSCNYSGNGSGMIEWYPYDYNVSFARMRNCSGSSVTFDEISDDFLHENSKIYIFLAFLCQIRQYVTLP